MKIIGHPETFSRAMPIFLGGSTSKGDWQKVVQNYMADTAAIFVNTCRPDWDEVEPTRHEKNKHIEWEFNWMNRVLNYFICIPADAKSPTVMLELGLVLAKPMARGVIYIDPGYSHFENARIAAAEYGFKVETDFDVALKKLKDLFLTFTSD